MKATLTIEVPDDFKKGDKSCEYCYTYAGASFRLCYLTHGKDCDADNCPLEIQEKSKTKPNKCEVECETCFFREVCSQADL